MKSEDPLAAALSGLPVPPATPGARERALHRATIALRQSGDVADGSPPYARRRAAGRFGMRWALAGVFVMLAAGAFWRLERPRRTEEIARQSIEIDRTVLGQMKALFGAQLNAVVERAGAAPDIRLSDGAEEGEAGQSQPVLIEFTRGGDLIRVLGYSGRPVCVDLAGRRTCFEPLATGDGGIILSGNGFCWTPQDRGGEVSGYRVATRLLPNS